METAAQIAKLEATEMELIAEMNFVMHIRGSHTSRFRFNALNDQLQAVVAELKSLEA